MLLRNIRDSVFSAAEEGYWKVIGRQFRVVLCPAVTDVSTAKLFV